VRDTTVPFYYTDQFGITFNIARGESGTKVNYFYKIGEDEQKQRNIAEVKRVLYVALTRAKHHLVISGRHTSANQSNTGVPLNMVLSSLGWNTDIDVVAQEKLKPYIEEIPDVPLDFFAYPAVGKRDGGFSGAASGSVSSIDKAFKTYREAKSPLNPPSPAEWTATELEALYFKGGTPTRELPPLSCDSVLGEEELEAAFGTLCHSMLETCINDALPAYRVPSLLKNRLSEANLNLVIAEANRLTSEFLALSAGGLLHGARNVETEVPFLLSYEVEGSKATISGVIDLLVDRTDECVLIDFKTNRFLRKGEYFLQGSIYRQAVSEWTGLPARCFIAYLREGSMIEVPDAPLPNLFSVVGSAYDYRMV
jgi:ATP-dependent exoDNAse (exonuclease V) beta subunit